MAEKKRSYKLVDVNELEFVNDQGETIPYYEIWVKSQEKRVLRFKPLDTKLFSTKLPEYRLLIGKTVSLEIDFKETRNGVIPVIAEITPIL